MWIDSNQLEDNPSRYSKITVGAALQFIIVWIVSWKDLGDGRIWTQNQGIVLVTQYTSQLSH
jgi:hypothetical protein